MPEIRTPNWYEETAGLLRGVVSDQQAVALTLFGEARGLKPEARQAVGAVILARYRIKFMRAKSLKDVCVKYAQFSCWWSFGGSANFRAVVDAGYQLRYAPSSSWGRALRISDEVALQVVEGSLSDNTDGATHYYHESLDAAGKAPKWAAKAEHTVTIGGHKFYRKVP